MTSAQEDRFRAALGELVTLDHPGFTIGVLEMLAVVHLSGESAEDAVSAVERVLARKKAEGLLIIEEGATDGRTVPG